MLQLKLVKTDHRANLKQESLLGLLTTKMTLLKSVPSNVSQTVKLEPTKEMLNLYKKMKSNAGNDKVTELWKTPS
jgi:glycerol-3-phosphate O-acyltransferase